MRLTADSSRTPRTRLKDVFEPRSPGAGTDCKMPLKKLLPLAMLPLACSPFSEDTPGSTSSAIAGGMRDTGHPNVVLLLSWDSSDPVGTLGSCTAEVVAPTVLLTAAHCFDSDRENNAAYLGDDGAMLGRPIDPGKAAVRSQLHMAKEVHAHPDHVAGPSTGYYDVGVVILQNGLTNVPALPINRTAPGSSNLSNLTIVGYGKTHDRDTTFAVTKYKADGLSATLDSTDTITVGDATRHACVGDSGGPVLAPINGVPTILGVDSYSDETGDATRCRMASHYQRVDKYLAFIDQYVPRSGTGGAAGTGGVSGTGGASATGGSTGTGGVVVSTGGVAGDNPGGTSGAGGFATGGAGRGTGGVPATGGIAGGAGGTGGSVSATGGAFGSGGIVGAGGESGLDPSQPLDTGCSMATSPSDTSVSGIVGFGLLAASLALRRGARRTGQPSW